MWALKRVALVALALSALALVVSAQPHDRYLYVAVPASELDAADIPPAILVFDIDKGHTFVRRVPLPRADRRDRAASQERVHVRGLAANANARRLFVSTTAGIFSIDLVTEKLTWRNEYDAHCCDRLDVSPDGSTIYAPAFGRPKWNVIRARDGELMTTIAVRGWPRQTIFSRDGRRAYLGAWESRVILVVDTTTHKVIREVGPFSSSVCPFTVNGRNAFVFANVDGLVGFEVGDLQTGLALDRVIVDTTDGTAWDDYECPSHGIALTPDERELWVADGVANRLHIYDATTYPPAPVRALELSHQPRWIMFSADGSYAYPSTGDVIDRKAGKIVGTLADEHGVRVRSDKMVEIAQ